LKNLPLPLFASAPADSPRRKRGVYSSLWQREVRRDFVIDVFILMTLLVIQIINIFVDQSEQM